MRVRCRNFEDLHPNHKMAFLDGLLTGAVLLWLAQSFRKDVKETHKV